MTRCFLFWIGCCLFMSGCALTKEDVSYSPRIQALLEEYPAGSIDSIETADKALAAVSYEHRVLQYQYGLDMDACSDRFLVNYCYEKTKLRFMKDKAAIKPLSIEADRFKRSEKIRLRDQALVNAQQNDLMKEAEREKSRQRYEEKEAKYVKEQTSSEETPPDQYINIKVGQEAEAPTLHKGAYTSLRPSQLKNPDTKITPQERQANIEKFEQKQIEAETRQAKTDRKKAETQAKRERHAASRKNTERRQKVADD